MIRSGLFLMMSAEEARALAMDISVALDKPDRLKGYWAKTLQEWCEFLTGERQLSPVARRWDEATDE